MKDKGRVISKLVAGGYKLGMRIVLLMVAVLSLSVHGEELSVRVEAALKLHREGEWAKAVEKLDLVLTAENLAKEKELVSLYQVRGVDHFMLGEMAKSVADFDRYLEANPEEKAGHWQRGIALYYAGRFEEGAKQFELHRTVNPEDVENAAWHFLCVARWKNVEAARAGLIAVKEDSRVPMAQVQLMFAGKMKPDEVIDAASAGKPEASQLVRQLFYAHLYVGLYYEALGEAAKAKEHIALAADKYAIEDYMCGVAKVHLKLLEKK